MKIIFIILFHLFSQSYVIHWESGGHTKYVIKQSNNNKTWTTTATITAKLSDNAFTYTLPLPIKSYYKVIADTYSSQSIYVKKK